MRQPPPLSCFSPFFSDRFLRGNRSGETEAGSSFAYEDFHFSPFLHPKAGSGFGVVFCFSPLHPDQKTGIIEKNRKPVRIFDLCRLRKKEKSLDIV
jgi:hypothetical protein